MPTLTDGIYNNQSNMHSQSSTNVDLMTVLKSKKKEDSVYVPFINERDSLGNLVSKKSDTSLNRSPTVIKNI